MSKRKGSRKGSGKAIIFGLTGAGIVVAAITGVVAYVMGKKAGWKEQSLATNGLYFQRGR